jgi:PhnB protein
MPKRPLNSKNNGRGKAVAKKIDKQTFDPKLDPKKVEQLSLAIDAMLASERNKVPKVSTSLKPLVETAASLRGLPREVFKARLRAELLQGRKTMASIAEAPAQVHTVAAPRLTFKNAAKAIDFYKEALGARETFRFEVGGSIPHAEIVIGDSTLMLAEEWPEGNRFSAETLGNSPVLLTLRVDDVDSFAARAVAAGMKVQIPIRDQFYGRREGTFADPFGYLWSISTVTEEMSVEEMHRRMKGATGPESGQPSLNQDEDESRSAAVQVRPGFPTITPYLVAQNADSLIDFIKKTFAAEELSRDVGSAGGYHCELRVEDSTLMIGGGAPKLAWKGDSWLGSFHIYVRDCDATYKLALQAGAKSLHAPADQPWGERTAHVIDSEGNRWYIATFKGENHRSQDAPAIQPFLHPLRAEPVIKFLKAAFAAEELGRFTSPDGVIHHTTLNIGTSHLEMGEAEGPYQPMKSMFYLYVPDSDALYRSAIAAGATSIHEPADQPYGDRVAAVTDPFGNQWWLGTPIRK